MHSVSVVVPTWKRADLIQQLLTNLSMQSRMPEQIVIVDNGSSDDTVAVARRFGITVVALDRNLGFAGAVNTGIQHSEGDWIVILNNDVLLAPDWLETILTTAAKTNAAFATGKLLQGSDDTRIDGTWDNVSRAGHAWRTGFSRTDGPQWSESRSIAMAPMTAALFRKDLFHQIGLLDTRFEAYYEDVDFGVRCALAGATGVYEPAAVGRHLGKGTLGKRSGRIAFLTARNQLFLLAKHCPASYLKRYAWQIAVGQMLGLVGASQQGQLTAALKGKREALRRWKEFRSEVSSYAEASSVFLASEHDIYRLQSSLGFDPYWRLYFKLIPKLSKEFAGS